MPRTPRQDRIAGQHTLSEFAALALQMLEQEPDIDEVVHLANEIPELQVDAMTPPGAIHPLPAGYEYHFSGWWGMYLGVRRQGESMTSL